jgi:hypothetical protein
MTIAFEARQKIDDAINPQKLAQRAEKVPDAIPTALAIDVNSLTGILKAEVTAWRDLQNRHDSASLPPPTCYFASADTAA